MRRKTLFKALLASFAVYLVPLVGRHGITFFGVVLWQELIEWRGARDPWWRLTDFGLAAVSQIAAFIVLLVVLRRPGRIRRAAALMAVVPATMAINWAYQIEIPLRYLIEPETAREIGDWPQQCALADAWLIQVRSGADVASERSGEAWVALGEGTRIAPMRLPDCQVFGEPIELSPAGSTVDSVAPGGAVLYRIYRREDGGFEHYFRSRAGEPPFRIDPPPGPGYWQPMLSSDGKAAAWLEHRRDSADQFSHVLHIKRFDGAADVETTIDQPEPALLHLVSFDAAKGQAVLSRYPDEFLAVDAAGRMIWGPVRAEGVRPVFDGFRRVDGGWVAWDSYREEGRYRLRWLLPAGSGLHEVPLGRSIHSVAIDAGGRYIAVSVGRNLSIGDVNDAIYVLDAADGAEIYRRFLAPYTRTQVAFLGAEALAVSLIEDGKSVVRVYVPPPR